MRKMGSRGSRAYNTWDREAAVDRALAHAFESKASGGSFKGGLHVQKGSSGEDVETDNAFVWNFAFGSNMSA